MRRALWIQPLLIACALSAQSQTAGLHIATGSTLPSGAAGAPYSFQFSATGGSTPYAWSLASGALPQGYSLSSSGVLGGTTSTAGNFSFGVKVTDSDKATATKTFNLTISSTLAINTTSPLPNGLVNSRYSQSIAVSGGFPPYLWWISSGTAPPGIDIDSNTGLLSGTPSFAGTFTFTVQVFDQSFSSVSKGFALTIAPSDNPPAIATNSQLPAGTAGTVYSQGFSATGGTAPYTWSVASGTLPTGLSLSSTGILGGTPATTGTYNFTVKVSDGASGAATKPFSLTINAAAINITSGPQLPNGSVGAQYSQTLAASGGTPPYTWSLKSGALPAGLTLRAATGTISGIPAASGTFNFQIAVKDSAKGSDTKSFSLQITPAAVSITTNPILPDGNVNAGYSLQLTATSGSPPYSWALASGALPPGLTLNATNGVIGGVPTTAGVFVFSIQVRDSASGTATQGFSITVHAPSLAISGNLGSGEIGIAYSRTLTAVGGTAPYQWTITGGALPAGVKLDSASGLISGLPQGAGTFNVTVQLRDAASQMANTAFQFVVAQRVSITNDLVLPAVAVGNSYLVILSAAGGVPPYLWSVSSGSLPPGLVLNAGSGAISGRVTTGGNYTFGVQVSDGVGGTATKQFTLNVGATLAIVMTSLPGATLGGQYTQNLIASGGSTPYTWSLSAGALPPGVSLNSAGSISGVPSGTGTFTFTLQVADKAGNKAAQQFSISVAQGVIIATTQLPNATVRTAYSQTLNAAGGSPPYFWSVAAGALPPGLTLSSPGGVISGTPTLSGTFSFTVKVTDAASLTATQGLQIAVGLTAPAIPQPAIMGLASSADTAEQLPIAVQLAAAYPSDVTGHITASFSSSASVPADDPSIQFASGGRTVDFTVKANTQQAVFPVSPMALQTGTVAGTITLNLEVQSAGAQPTTASQTIQVMPAVPAIRSVSLVTTSTGFEVHITGLSNTREVSEADLRFQAAAGSSIQTSSLSVNLSASAKQWYQSAASVPFGSQFVLVLPFNVQGGVNSIASVSVILKNSVGNSTSASATF